MAKLKPFVTDEQRIRLEPFRPKPQPSAKGGSKPRGNRQVFDGIIRLWPTGAGWNHLADRYPSASTCSADYSHGKTKVFGSKYGLSSCPNWSNKAS